MQPSEKFARAIELIDAANAEDPQTIVVDGIELPKEPTHARLLTEWVERLNPDASEQLLLAARAMHIRRWTSSRQSYPADRKGYLRWRTELKKMHQEQAGLLMEQAGYDAAAIARVQQLISKANRQQDPEVQTLEDGLCLVFLQTQLSDLAARLDDEKMIGILRKSWAKMSPAAHYLAHDLPFDDRSRDLVGRALAPD